MQPFWVFLCADCNDHINIRSDVNLFCRKARGNDYFVKVIVNIVKVSAYSGKDFNSNCTGLYDYCIHQWRTLRPSMLCTHENRKIPPPLQPPQHRRVAVAYLPSKWVNPRPQTLSVSEDNKISMGGRLHMKGVRIFPWHCIRTTFTQNCSYSKK